MVYLKVSVKSQVSTKKKREDNDDNIKGTDVKKNRRTFDEFLTYFSSVVGEKEGNSLFSSKVIVVRPTVK